MTTASRSLLVIGWVWPEPTSSAAGSHMLSLLRSFMEQGFNVTFASTAQPTEFQHDLTHEGIDCQSIRLNCESFDAFVAELQPSVVLFDRFMMEEQFGWRVDKACPNALKLLDTEDLQSLRDARHQLIKKGLPLNDEHVRPALMASDLACREIASILRCDLSLIISSVEMQLLNNWFGVASDLTLHLPFMVEDAVLAANPHAQKGFEQRAHFVTIGNFRHAPNWDSLLQLQSLWPSIRQQLPGAELHIYGAYTPPKAQQLHQPSKGIRICDRADHAVDTLKNYRLCLAPLRFGAGIKGKLLDAMLAETPSVTTPIGAEGMTTTQPWPGIIAADTPAFVDGAVNLYRNSAHWNEAQARCLPHAEQCFSESQGRKALFKAINPLLEQQGLQQHRLNNFTGRMLRHHSLRSTQYMSQWIEAKTRLADLQASNE